jgi:hypothetical protein
MYYTERYSWGGGGGGGGGKVDRFMSQILLYYFTL